MHNLYEEPRYEKLIRSFKEDLKSLIESYKDTEALEKMMSGK